MTVIRRVRCWLGDRLFALASWVYAYAKHDPDDETRKVWNMDATFYGTEAEADARFEQLCDIACTGPHGPMEPCDFIVGGMQVVPDEEQAA